MDIELIPLSASVDAQGMLRGEITETSVKLVPEFVKIVCNGAWSATVPVVSRAEPNSVIGTFRCRLPPVGAAREDQIDIFDAASGTRLTSLEKVAREPVYNKFGLCAYDVLTGSHSPMFGVPWLSFDGARITVSGCHLPPGGDPSRLSVQLAPGVRYKFVSALESQEFGANFWYYPNAHLSGFILTIDLVASAPDSDPFYFDFVYSPDGTQDNSVPTVSRRNKRLRQRVWIPREFRSFVGYPHDKTLMTRVQTWSDAQSVSFTGYNVFCLLSDILQEYGIKPDAGVSVLDWGCGHGRVTRHFIDAWPHAEILGADIDAENVAWCQKNLSRGSFHTFPLMPQTDLPSASLDAVFGISVMTHLTSEAQEAWLQELRRILKPGGIALLTYGADSAAAWGSYWQRPEWWKNWIATGFDDGLNDPALAGKIGDDGYYRITTQSTEWTVKSWSRFFDVVATEADLVGNQNMAVLRRR